jgi:DNA-binding NarL/FixJ family response regulator
LSGHPLLGFSFLIGTFNERYRLFILSFITFEIAWVLRTSVAMIGIIILTQFPAEERLFQFLKVGANAYTTRTISPEVLIETVRRVCSGEFLFSNE